MTALSRIPNAVTIARGLCGPIGAFLLLESRHAGVALQDEALSNAYALASALMFVLAAASDGLDGWLARRLNAESALGALLDPIADKLLVGSYLIAFVMITQIDLWLAAPVAIIIARDLTVTALRFRATRPAPLAVTHSAKIKTAMQMLVTAAPFALIMLGFRDVGIWYYYWVGAVWALAVVTVWTALPYFRAARSGGPA